MSLQISRAVGALCAYHYSLLCAHMIRYSGSRAWLFGGAAGLIYAMLAYAVFSILSGSFALNMAMLSDMGIGLLAGMLCAMVTRAAAH